MELRLPFTPPDNRLPGRPTTELPFSQWSTSTVGRFLGFLITGAIQIINGIEGCGEVLEEDIFEWLDVENQHPSFQILNDEEIIQAVDPSSDINDADIEDLDFEDLRTISHTEGVQALTTALKYLEPKSNVTPIDLLFLKNWRDRAATDRNSGLLQRKKLLNSTSTMWPGVIVHESEASSNGTSKHKKNLRVKLELIHPFIIVSPHTSKPRSLQQSLSLTLEE
ncbi:hypothetical protein AVEN_153551-1 [Araneus ventricosus]|uniref:Jerky-like n=1 Tax=Araneus ventricosus TaxID=182803 RepID=A0A4Y2G8E5_ARAVE|nr:hypothetical protein AVEN_153551-1 [Araneus ventricosus]